jgi:hypothetical protein
LKKNLKNEEEEEVVGGVRKGEEMGKGRRGEKGERGRGR